MSSKTLSYDTFNPGNGFIFTSAYKLRFHPVDRVWKLHNGGDFAAAAGTPLRAAADGVVDYVFTDPKRSYGYAVVLKHTREDGSIFYSLQGHMNDLPMVKKGDVVTAGDVIGAVGNTGKSDGAHLHFEIIQDQANPLVTGHLTENPATFSNWGNIPHMVGTDANGNVLVAITSGSPEGGNYGRIVTATNQTTGEVVGSYGTTATKITGEAGQTVGYRFITKGDTEGPIKIDIVDAEGNLVRSETLDAIGQRTSLTQSGIQIETTPDGQRIAYVPGRDTGIVVSPNGDIDVETGTGEGFTIRLSDDPFAGGTCSAGTTVVSFKSADEIGICPSGVIVSGGDEQDPVWKKVSEDGIVTDLYAQAKALVDGLSGFWNGADRAIARSVCTTFFGACAAPRSDPLTLDLDGDGIETTGINATAPVMFDISGSGVQQSVGWVAADDGFLVRDLNSNGLIDSGTELFGDATTLANGTKSTDGFAALADLDANQDGVVNASDAAFSQLRVWRDLDQDGVTDAGELQTLASLGVAGLNVAATSHTQTLTNGNEIADLGTFIKADGQVGTLGQTADVNLAVDTFTSQFTDTLPVSGAVLPLPDMQGSGQVRSLHEAATLSPALAALITQFAESADRATQRSLLDQIVTAWSDTSTMVTTFTGAFAGHPLTIYLRHVEAGAATDEWARKLTILERFNGRTFTPVPADGDPVLVDIAPQGQALLQQSYDALRESVYGERRMELNKYLERAGNDFEWRTVA